MSLIGKIVTLFSDKEKTAPVFPRTKVSAVSDDDGVGLNVLLDNVNEAIDNVRITADAAQDVVTPAEEDEGKILKVVDGAASWANHKIGRKDLENDALYSPIIVVSGNVSLSANHLGRTINFTDTTQAVSHVFTITKENSEALPIGFEAAILFAMGESLKIVFSGGVGAGISGHGWEVNPTITIPDKYSMVAIKKINSSNNWLVTGNVEVV